MAITFQPELLQCVARVVSQYASNNEMAAELLPDIIRSTYTAFNRAHSNANSMKVSVHNPAVALDKSVSRPVTGRRRNGAKPNSNIRHLTSHESMPNVVRTQQNSSRDHALEATKAMVSTADVAGTSKATVHLAELGNHASAEVKRIPEGVSGLKTARRKNFLEAKHV